MRFKYIGDMLIMDDKLPEDVWESIYTQHIKTKRKQDILDCAEKYET